MYTYPDGLESDRLRTRYIVAEDAVAWMDFIKDPIATTFLPAPPGMEPEEFIKRWIDFTLLRYDEQRYGLQALICKETGEFVGLCGLLLQELNGVNEIEIGYHLFRKHWGKGYASEAAQMFRDFGFRNNVAPSIISIIHPVNLPSKNVAKRNGMTLVQRGTFFRDKEVDIFRITRQEWLKLTDK